MCFFKYRNIMLYMFPKVVAQFFSLRGIDHDTLKKFGIWWNGVEIVIPIKDEKGKTLFNKYRRSPESNDGPKYRNEHGSTATLFNYNPNAKTVIITESELDAVLLCSLGYDACSSTGGSSTFPKEWVILFENKKVYLCYDADTAGVKGAVKIANLFPVDAEIKLISFDEYWKGKDVTEYLQNHKKEEFDVLIKKAVTLPRPSNDTIKEINSAIDKVTIERRRIKSDRVSTALLEEHLQILNGLKQSVERKKKKKEFDDDFTNVKQVPIDRFIDFNGAGFANCIWHSEKSPSMKYYPKTNLVFCFGCSKSADVISVVRQINSCTFPQALDILKTYL